ncbi:hypothetical protein [Streptomyces zagrosensis]|uniref:Putative HAF family extracellular repeat protein n=1 Tax=Streptomyces zagrosensis TaxID=1042984 RepID=A0A7W9QGD3_9ACTN|nr:hypothetical protein [Streptomyces zagrosensis]MBB5939776.1 putative HAF family extracellular repeat protein [Streptomyces zagrosensis]
MTLRTVSRYDASSSRVARRPAQRARPLGILASAALAAASLVVGVAPAAVADSPESAPTLTQLPFLPGDWYSEPTGLNDDGVIVGYSTPSDGIYSANYRDRAARWNPDNSIAALPPAPGDVFSRATGVNSDGTIAGYSWPTATADAARHGHAVRWDDGIATALPPLAGDPHTRPAAINEAGVIAGASWEGEGGHTEGRAVTWKADGSVVSLPPLSGDTFSVPLDINNAGIVVGYSWSGRLSATHAVQWSPDGTPTDLGALIRKRWPDHDSSYADEINDAGAVIGNASRAYPQSNTDPHAVRWDADGTTRDLGLRASASAINAQGDIAGSYPIGDTRRAAQLWSADGTSTALPFPAGMENNMGDGATLNDSQTVVGNVWSGNPSRENKLAVRWQPDGSAINLGTAPGDPYSSASFVNAEGTIAGVSIRKPIYTYLAGSHHAVVWRR